jgi:hypothetical protein
MEETQNEFANQFSKCAQSLKVVLDSMPQGEIYSGKGKSLQIRWLEKGINSNARRSWAVVIHGAEYVSNSFIQNNES